MRKKAIHSYLANTSIKYTAGDIIKLTNWLDNVDMDMTLKFGEIYVLFSASLAKREKTLYITSFKNGIKEGEACCITGPNIVFSSYQNNIKIGNERHFIDDNEIKGVEIINFDNSHHITSYKNCQLFINDVKYGHFVDNYLDGFSDCVKGYYINGKYHGLIKTYRKNEQKLGTLKKTEEYVYGVLHGETRLYYENGQLATTCTYVFGKLYGKVTDYTKEGKMYKVSFCIADQKVTEDIFNKFHKKYGSHLKKINKYL